MAKTDPPTQRGVMPGGGGEFFWSVSEQMMSRRIIVPTIWGAPNKNQSIAKLAGI